MIVLLEILKHQRKKSSPVPEISANDRKISKETKSKGPMQIKEVSLVEFSLSGSMNADLENIATRAEVPNPALLKVGLLLCLMKL